MVDLDTGKTRNVFTKWTRHAAALRFSSDNKRLIVASRVPGAMDTASDTRLVTWDLAEGKKLGERKLDGGGQPLAFAASGKGLLTRPDSPQGVLALSDVDTGKSVKLDAKEATRRGVQRAVISSDASRIALLDHEGYLSVWQFPSCKLLWRCLVPGDGTWPVAVLFSPDGKTVMAAQGRQVVFWDIAKGRRSAGRVRLGVTSADAAAISPDGKVIALDNGDLFLWSVEKRQYVAVLQTSGPRGAAWPKFSQNGDRVVAIGAHGEIRVWDLRKRYR